MKFPRSFDHQFDLPKHLAQSTLKDSSGEGLIGLLDGAQAIIMTLLVIEMPILIIELVEHAKDSQELFFNLTMDVFGYFFCGINHI